MTHYRPGADSLSASLTDGAVLLHLHTKRYFSLNDTGARIWTLLEQQRTEEQIVETLIREYDVGEPDARRAVHALVQDLLVERLIEPVKA